MEWAKKIAAGTIVSLLVVMIAVIFLDQPISDTANTFRDGQSYGSYQSKEIPYYMINFFYSNCSEELESENNSEIRSLLLPYCVENRLRQVLITADLAAEIGVEATQAQAKDSALLEAKNYFEGQELTTAPEDRLSFADWYRRITQSIPIKFRAQQISAQNFGQQFSVEFPEANREIWHREQAQKSQIRLDILSFNRTILEKELGKTISKPELLQKKIEAIFKQISSLDKQEIQQMKLEQIQRIVGSKIFRGKLLSLEELANIQTPNGTFNFLQPGVIAYFQNAIGSSSANASRSRTKLIGPMEIETRGVNPDQVTSQTVFLRIADVRVPSGTEKRTAQNAASKSSSRELQNTFLQYLIERQAARGNFSVTLPEFN